MWVCWLFVSTREKLEIQQQQDPASNIHTIKQYSTSIHSPVQRDVEAETYFFIFNKYFNRKCKFFIFCILLNNLNECLVQRKVLTITNTSIPQHFYNSPGHTSLHPGLYLVWSDWSSGIWCWKLIKFRVEFMFLRCSVQLQTLMINQQHRN